MLCVRACRSELSIKYLRIYVAHSGLRVMFASPQNTHLAGLLLVGRASGKGIRLGRWNIPIAYTLDEVRVFAIDNYIDEFRVNNNINIQLENGCEGMCT